MPKLMPGADVWFRPGAHELQLLSDQPSAAKVTYVHHSGLVNLIVWGKGGETHQRASVPFWGGEGDAPTSGNYASWVDEGGFDVLDAPATADVTRHPFEGRPSGGQEDLDRAWARNGLLLDRARAAQAALDGRRNMDHGAPRGAPSPYSGGPVAVEEAKAAQTHPAPIAPDYQAAQPDPSQIKGEYVGGEPFGFLDARPSDQQEARATASAAGFGDQQAKSVWDPKAPPFGTTRDPGDQSGP